MNAQGEIVFIRRHFYLCNVFSSIIAEDLTSDLDCLYNNYHKSKMSHFCFSYLECITAAYWHKEGGIQEKTPVIIIRQSVFKSWF